MSILATDHHRVLPQVSPRLRAFYVLAGDRYEVYNTCNSPYRSQRQGGEDSGKTLYSFRLPSSRRPKRPRTPRPISSEPLRGISPCTTTSDVNPKNARKSRHTSHSSLPTVQLNRGSSPAFSILPLIPAPSNSPNTVSRNRVTTSWSLGESLSYHNKQRPSATSSELGPEQERSRKQRASTSPSFPVAVSGSASPNVAPAHIGRFWLIHHCFVQDRHGLFGLSGKLRCRIV